MNLMDDLAAGCRVRDGGEPYARDSAPFCPTGLPVALALPTSVTEVRHVLRTASAHGVPVVPQGARTGLAGGANAVDGCVLLDLTGMDRILEIDPAERLARCEPGVTTGTLRAAVAEHGLHYPPDPVSRDTCTIGGNIATNAGGLCCVKYGVTGDHVLGLTAVLADGRLLRTGGGTAKGVAGFDLTRLLVGSEGTLGVIVEATLALRPAAAPTRGLLAQFETAREAGLAAAAVIAAGHTPTALELMDRRLCGAIRDLGHDLAAAPALAVECAEEELAEIAALCGGAVTDQALELRRLIAPAMARIMAGMDGRPTALIEDVAVPRGALPTLIDQVERIAARAGLFVGTSGHAGDGNLHPIILFDADDPGAVARASSAADAIMAAGLELGGTVTGEHGVGLLKRDWLATELDPVSLELQRGLKRLFDPAGLLNPGKVLHG